MPLLLETPYVLEFWLKDNLPEKTVIFTRLMLINSLLDLFTYPISTGVQATGKVKWYQIFVGGTLLLIVPAAICIKRFTSLPVEYVFYASICISALAHIGRLYFAKSILSLSIGLYLKKVILPVAGVSVAAAIVPTYLALSMEMGLQRFLIVGTVCVVSTAISVWYLGMTTSERQSIINLINRLIHRK